MNKTLLKVDEIIDLIYEGPLEPDPWQSFVRCLRERTDSDLTNMTLRLGRNGLMPLAVWDRGTPMDDNSIVELLQCYRMISETDPLYPVTRQSGEVHTLSEVIPPQELQRNAYYQQVMRPSGMEYEIRMGIAEPSGLTCTICAANSAATGDFGDVDKQFFRSLLPHLERALAIYAKLKCNECEKDVFAKTIDNMNIGVFILDGRGKVIDSNQAARTLLQSYPALSLVQDKLTITRAEQNIQLKNLVKQAISWREHHENDAFFEVMRVDNLPGIELGLLVRPIVSGHWYRNDVSPTVIVYISDPQQQQVAHEKIVAKLFGLTNSEAHLALLMANGLSLTEAAEVLEITENSARSYSKKIFAKTGTSRQAELVRLILKSVALLA